MLDLLSKTGKLGVKLCNTAMTPNVQITKEGDLFEDLERYIRLVEKLNYLIVTRPDIAYSVSVLSQYMSSPIVGHWTAVEHILCYLKEAPRCGISYKKHGHNKIECFPDTDWVGSKKDRRSTSGYCVFFGGNLISWKSKKQSVVSRSSTESKDRAMTHFVCEIMWIHQLLIEVGIETSVPVKLWCDNQVVMHIASNPVFHEQTKHFEINCYFIRKKIQLGFISTGYVKTEEQLRDIFTKPLSGDRVGYLCNMINICALT